jgi:23S rRNA (uracil-5-)-methyltransferase RumA
MEPLCPYFGKCGGCSSQHISYSQQIEAKKKQLANAIKFEGIPVFHGKEYNYRNRMDFIFNNAGLGFRKKQNLRQVVDVENCAISEEKLNLLLKEARAFFKDVDVFDAKKNTGTFRYAVIRTPKDDSSISFVLNSDSQNVAQAIEKIKLFAETSKANNIIITYVPKNTDSSVSNDFFAVKGSDVLKENLLGKTFFYSVQGFFQNNTDMAEKLQEYVNSLLKNYEAKDAQLLDLYAGVGTFGIVNANLFKEVKIVESAKECIDAAEKNIRANNITNAEAVLLDAKNLKKLELKTPLFVITDPPRSGMHPRTIDQLNNLNPELIIYISCNIQQLSKDLPKFKGYKLKSAAMFDLFPQTPHIEAVVELVRSA